MKEKFKSYFFAVIPIIIGCTLAHYIQCDYNVTGIIYIVVLFALRNHKFVRNIVFILIVIYYDSLIKLQIY